MKIALVVLVALTGAVACSPVASLPLTQHPTARPINSAGVSVGAAYAFPEESGGPTEDALLNLPYGEGWARLAAGPGQLELRMLPGVGQVGYRFDVTSESSSVTFAVQPAFGLGYYREVKEGDDDSLMFLAPSLAGVLVVNGGFYLVPQAGYGLFHAGEGDNPPSVYMLGLAAGYRIDARPFAISLELAFQRVKRIEREGYFGDATALWALVPSVGFQLDAPEK